MSINIASIYQYIYLLFVTIITLIYIRKYKHNLLRYKKSNVAELLLVVTVALFIGLRPISGWFIDMYSYNQRLQQLDGQPFWFTTDTDNIIFDNFLEWWGCNGISPTLFFLTVATIYFVCAYIGIKRLFKDNALIAYIVFLAAFSTFSYSTNGIKAGAAASIFIMALGYRNKLWLCLPLMLASMGFHHSMALPIAAFAPTIFFKNPKWYYYGWLACFLLASFHITYFQILFGGMADEQGAGYLLATEQTSEAHIGFRPDFVLYSAVPVWMGYQIEMKKKIIVSATYKMLIHFYLTANAAWMLCMYASFTNRIAYLSWFVYPIVIIYPFLDKKNNDPNRYAKLKKVVIYHLLFTLFMVIVYYGILSLGN